MICVGIEFDSTATHTHDIPLQNTNFCSVLQWNVRFVWLLRQFLSFLQWYIRFVLVFYIKILFILISYLLGIYKIFRYLLGIIFQKHFSFFFCKSDFEGIYSVFTRFLLLSLGANLDRYLPGIIEVLLGI